MNMFPDYPSVSSLLQCIYNFDHECLFCGTSLSQKSSICGYTSNFKSVSLGKLLILRYCKCFQHVKVATLICIQDLHNSDGIMEDFDFKIPLKESSNSLYSRLLVAQSSFGNSVSSFFSTYVDISRRWSHQCSKYGFYANKSSNSRLLDSTHISSTVSTVTALPVSSMKSPFQPSYLVTLLQLDESSGQGFDLVEDISIRIYQIQFFSTDVSADHFQSFVTISIGEFNRIPIFVFSMLAPIYDHGLYE